MGGGKGDASPRVPREHRGLIDLPLAGSLSDLHAYCPHPSPIHLPIVQQNPFCCLKNKMRFARTQLKSVLQLPQQQALRCFSRKRSSRSCSAWLCIFGPPVVPWVHSRRQSPWLPKISCHNSPVKSFLPLTGAKWPYLISNTLFVCEKTIPPSSSLTVRDTKYISLETADPVPLPPSHLTK